MSSDGGDPDTAGIGVGAAADVPPDVAELFGRIEEIGGFLPNGFSAMAHKPAVVRLVAELTMEVMSEDRVALSTKWLVANVASKAAGCRYCWAHTGSNASQLAGIDPAKVEAIWDYENDDRFSEAERVAMDFGLAAASVPNRVTAETFERLRGHYDDEQIVEIASVVCLFGWFNRWNDSMATELEAEPAAFASTHLTDGGWTLGRHGNPQVLKLRPSADLTDG